MNPDVHILDFHTPSGKLFWRVWQAPHWWLSVRYGWLYPYPENVRFYSRFSTRETAQRAFRKINNDPNRRLEQ